MVLLRSAAGKPKGTHSSAWRASIWLQRKFIVPILNPLPKERRVLILCLGRDSPTPGKIYILGTYWQEARGTSDARLSGQGSVSSSSSKAETWPVPLNVHCGPEWALSAHEFTQPLLPSPLLPAAVSGIGSQLGGTWKGPTETERLR